MIKAIDANMYLLLFVENIAPIQEIDTANCIHFKLNSCLISILLMFFGNLEEMDLISPWSIVIIHCLE